MVWDWLIVGSGFGGSVSALRLAEKGYSVLVLEKGGRWRQEDFPKSNWNLRRWLWAPAIGFRGFFKMTFLRHVTALSGVGVGGGSLVYANTLPTPEKEFLSAAAKRLLHHLHHFRADFIMFQRDRWTDRSLDIRRPASVEILHGRNCLPNDPIYGPQPPRMGNAHHPFERVMQQNWNTIPKAHEQSHIGSIS